MRSGGRGRMKNLVLNRRRSGIIWSGLDAAVLCIIAASSLHAQTKTPDAHPTLLNHFRESMGELSARVSPAVVQVRVTGYRAVVDKDRDETGLIGRQRSLASGGVVYSDGYLHTN